LAKIIKNGLKAQRRKGATAQRPDVRLLLDCTTIYLSLKFNI
jgi:hypothetical protein